MIGKKIGGRTYYYLAESARVDGKPRVVTQRYLGTAEEIARAVPAGEPASAHYRTYGDVAAVWATLRRLDFVPRVDTATGTKLGTTLAIAVLHRAIAPETPIGEWWETSAARDFVRAELTWRALERLTPQRISAVEEVVAGAVLELLDDRAALAVDVPQFAVFTADPPLLAGLGLLVTRDGAIPLASRVYRRDDGTAPTFAALMGQLGPATLVFHAGQAAQLDLGSRSGFVGSLPLTNHPSLLSESASVRKCVDPERFPGVTALDTHAVVDGVRRRVILTHSETLHAAQSRAFADELATATREIDGLAEALAAGTHRGDRAQVHAELGRVTRGRRIERVLSAVLSGSKAGEIRLERRIDAAAIARLDEEFFGKQVLVTDQDWPVAEVVTAYRARTHLESTFRWLGGQAVAGPTQRWEWTRHRVAVHALVSVLAATVTHLMRRDADRAGMNLSVRELLDRLAGIGEFVLRHPSTGGRPRTTRMATERTPDQEALAELFQIATSA